MTVQDLIEKRGAIWEQAQKFLDEHTGKDDKVSAEDAAALGQMIERLNDLTEMIDGEKPPFSTDMKAWERYMNQPRSKPILSYPQHNDDGFESPRREFLNQFRTGFRTAQNTLREASQPDGGYLVPTEFDAAIVSSLESENVMRQIGRTITTASEHKISIVATKPTASWVTEGQQINFSSTTFSQISLNAYKLAVAIQVSNELLQDSFYNLEEFLTTEFGRALARAEEEAFISGTGSETGMPQGIIPTIAADESRYITTTASGVVSADDLISLQYSLPRPYRKNAVWLINDESLAQIRKLKDSSQNFLWQPTLQESEPPRLLGAPVYSSPFMPTAQSAKIAVLYGDFKDYFTIGERGQRVVKPLRELYAMSDLTAFLMLERIDAVLTDTQAVKGLYVR